MAVSAAALILLVVAIAVATDLGLRLVEGRAAAVSSRVLPGRSGSGVLLMERSAKIISGGGKMGWWGLMKAETAD